MTDTDDIRFLAEKLGIEFEEAEQRSALSLALLDAAEALEETTNELMKAITLRLEGREDGDDRWQNARRQLTGAIDRFDIARRDASIFLLIHGSQVPEDQHPESVWDAQVGVDEEGLADATSALIQGTITRSDFDERRAQVVAARAKFDAEVDAAIGRVGALDV
jgi:hypothetical protein